MTLRECIDKLDSLKPNQYSEEEKVRWLAFLEANIYNDLILTHDFGEVIEYTPYTVDDLDKELIAQFPYDEVYLSFLKMKVDEENQETTRYNNSAMLYNSHLDNYAKYVNKNYKHKSRPPFRFY